MNLKTIFKKEIKLENTSLNEPKIIFEDLELQVTIGQWLGILSSQQGFGNSGLTIYTLLSAKELMKRINVSNEKLKEISANFGHLLTLAGIDKSETCTLNQFDKEKSSFNCHFNNSNNDANISLRWGSFIDSGPEFIIDYQNEKRTYDYREAYKDKPARLNLQQYIIKNVDNNNSCSRYLSPHSAYFTLKNEQHSLTITIERPESIKKSGLGDCVFRLKKEDELQQYLLGLTFPLDINEVYKKICEISLDSITEYPKFDLEVKSQINEKQDKTTDMISLRYGLLNIFIITREGKTVTIDSAGNWSYASPELAVSQEKNGNINYSLNSISYDEISSLASPLEQFNMVSQEVEQVRTLTKTLLKK